MKMSLQKCDCFVKRFERRRVDALRTTDQHDFKSEGPGRVEFGTRSIAATILGDNDLYLGLAHQVQFIIKTERAACQQHLEPGQVRAGIRRIDRANQIIMLGRSIEGWKLQSANRQKYTSRSIADPKCCAFGIDKTAPAVAGLGSPRRAAKYRDRNLHELCRRRRVRGYLFGKGMGRIDHRVDGFFAEEIRKTLEPTEAADAIANLREHGRFRPSCERKNGIETGIAAQPCGKRTRLCRAA